MSSSPVHLAPSRNPAGAAGATTRSAPGQTQQATSFDLLLSLQLGADDGSLLAAPLATSPDSAANAAETAALPADTPAPLIDPAQLLWNPLDTTATHPAVSAAESDDGLANTPAASPAAGFNPEIRGRGQGDSGPPAAGEKSDAPVELSGAPSPHNEVLPAAVPGTMPERKHEFSPVTNEARTENVGAPATSLAPGTPAPTGVTQAAIQAPVGSPAFADQLAQQVAVFVDQKQLTARIQVHPPELGPVDVQVQVRADQVQVDFFATQADTRDALETAIPRLKEMLAEQGLSLTGSQVGTRDGSSAFTPPGGHEAGTPGGRAATGDAQTGGSNGDTGESPPALSPAAHRLRSLHLVDTFA